MSYRQYEDSRNLTWKVLLDHNISQLPVKISDVCEDLEIPIISFSDGEELIRRFGLGDRLGNDGFTGELLGRKVIFYNPERSTQRTRFTVAHELGHLLLGHTMNETQIGVFASGPNREPDPKDDPVERQANIFASRILAPACVMWGLGIQNAGQLAEVCNISAQSAQFRMERMNELYERDWVFRQQRGRGCFLRHPAERAVFEQFRPYIEKNRIKYL